MKCSSIIAFIIGTCFTIPVLAQDDGAENSSSSKIYMKVYGAYGLVTPGSFRGVSNNDNNDVNIIKVQKKGMGGGIRVGAGIGYIINEYINVGIDGEYLMGNTLKVKIDDLKGASITTRGTTTYEHEIYSVIPNIVFKAISKPSYYVYNRIGVVIGIPKSITETGESEYHYINNFAAVKELEQSDILTNYKGEYKLYNAVGYQGVLGIQIKLAEKIRGFAEAAVYGLSFNINKYQELTRVVQRTDKKKGTATSTTETDNSIYLRTYSKTGVPNASPKMISGTRLNAVYENTLPEAHMNMNAITIGLGIAVRF